jgi:hypothetical protein
MSSSTTSGLGAGADPMNPRELRYLVDNAPQVLPTFGNVAASLHMTEPPKVRFPGIDIELTNVLHASEAVSVPAPLPAAARPAPHGLTEIWDKGKAAVIVSETTVTDPDGRLLWTTKRRSSPGARAASTVSGDRQHRWSSRIGQPTWRCGCRSCRRGPALPVVRRPQPAALGSAICCRGWFPRPILHGLCTYGIACNAMVDALLDGDDGRAHSFGARFAGVVFPGETLRGTSGRRPTAGLHHCAESGQCGRAVGCGVGARVVSESPSSLSALWVTRRLPSPTDTS